MNHRSKLLVVDESALSLDRYDPSLNWLAKTSRHLGHSAIFIAHNLKDVAKGIRTQCTQIFIFASSRSDVRDLEDEFDDKRILGATKLKKFHFIRITSNDGISFGKVDPNTLEITVETDPSPLPAENPPDLKISA